MNDDDDDEWCNEEALEEEGDRSLLHFLLVST